jgi:hypothetical protein
MWCIALLVPVTSTAGYFLFGAKGLFASCVGSLLALVNLWAVTRIVRGMVEETRLRSRWSLLAFLKMTALIFTIYALIAGGFPVLAIAIGYAAMPIGIVVGQLWAPAPAADDPATNKG